jgi:hypothetical protein
VSRGLAVLAAFFITRATLPWSVFSDTPFPGFDGMRVPHAPFTLR